PVSGLACLLLDDALCTSPSASVVVDWALADRLKETAIRGRDLVPAMGTAESMFATMSDVAAVAGFDSKGRFWMSGPQVATDAMVTLGRLQQILGRDGEPLSKRLRRLMPA